MIFAVAGSQKFQFSRLFQMLDKMVEAHLIQDEIFAQIGCSDYRPQNYKYASFLKKNDFENCIHNCDLLITHGGVATIVSGLKEDKPVIVVPRLAKYGEHVDNHQKQIADIFKEQNFVMVCSERDPLKSLIQEAKNHRFAKYKTQRVNAILEIQDYLSKL